MNVLTALGLIALGMCVDALYQFKIRVAECDAYKTGYQQGKKEEQIRCEERAKLADGKRADVIIFDDTVAQNPSMAAPVKMPDNFEEHMRKHGRATAKIK